MEERMEFELYKSTVCHRLKREGDIEFLKNTLVSNRIRILFEKEWYPESLYLLAMVDYISRINDVPLCNIYNDIRCTKLSDILYPVGVKILAYLAKNDDPKEQSLKEAIPEFLRYNIVEAEIRNVY